MLRINNLYNYPIIISIIIKIAIILILSLSVLNGHFYLIGSDEWNYLSPALNIFKTGIYGHGIEPIAYRMPSIGFIFASLIQILGEEYARITIVVLQLLSDFLISYFLYKISYLITQNIKTSFWVMFIYNLNTFVLVWSFYIYTEIFGLLFFVISVFSLLLFEKNKVTINLIFSGLFLILAVYFRVFFVIFIPAYLLYIILIEKKLVLIIKSILAFSFFIVLLDGSWIVRNYIHFKKIIPLQSDEYGGYKYSKTYSELRGLVADWGLDPVVWNPKSEILYFGDFGTKYTSPISKLPSCVFTEKYDEAFYAKLKSHLVGGTFYKQNNDSIIASKIIRARADFRNNRPIIYYFVAPLSLFYKFVFHSGTYNISSKSFHELSIIMKLFKLSMSVQYFSLVIIGTLTLIISILKINLLINSSKLLVLIISISLFFMCFIHRNIEYRYFVPIYPFLLLLTIIFISNLITKKNVSYSNTML